MAHPQQAAVKRSLAEAIGWRTAVSNTLALFSGLTLMSLGIVITISTPWGVQPWDVLHLGLVKDSGLSFGTISQITGAVVVLATLALGGRSLITWVTLVNVLVMGFEMDFFLRFVPVVGGWPGLFYLQLGVALAALGMALYLAPQWGAGPRDSLMLAMTKRSGAAVSTIRVGIDVAVVMGGYLLGGPVGLGTVVAALTTGPWAQFFMRWVARRRR